MVWVVLFTGLLLGCASRIVPPELRATVNRNIPFRELAADPVRYRGELVVLGGLILASKNQPEWTEIEILQKPLDQTDEPRQVDDTAGRFIARHSGYLETTVYTKDRRVTVLGEVIGRENRPIGEIEYPYPIISIQKILLWPEVKADFHDPYGYDPFYYPYWWYRPHSRYPYHRYWP